MIFQRTKILNIFWTLQALIHCLLKEMGDEHGEILPLKFHYAHVDCYVTKEFLISFITYDFITCSFTINTPTSKPGVSSAQWPGNSTLQFFGQVGLHFMVEKKLGCPTIFEIAVILSFGWHIYFSPPTCVHRTINSLPCTHYDSIVIHSTRILKQLSHSTVVKRS